MSVPLEIRAYAPVDLPEVLTVPEVADLLRVSRKTIYAAVSAGTIPAIRLGRAVRIPRDVVQRLCAAGTRP